MTVCDTPISKGAQSLLKEVSCAPAFKISFESLLEISNSYFNGSNFELQLLQYASELRLGFYGAVEIKTHPFFDGLEWDKMAEGGTSEQPQLSIS